MGNVTWSISQCMGLETVFESFSLNLKIGRKEGREKCGEYCHAIPAILSATPIVFRDN